MKKTKKSNCIQGMLVAVLKKFAPKYCVRKKTLLSNPKAEMYLPGYNKEYPIAKNMRDCEISQRLWSPETRRSLFESGNSALIKTVCSEDELMCVFASGNEDNMLKALSVYTPTKDFVLRELPMQTYPFNFKVAKHVPTVFKKLSLKEFFRIANGSVRKMMLALARGDKSGEWAVKFVNHILEGGTGGENLSELVEIAMGYNKKLNLKKISELDYRCYSEAVARVGFNSNDNNLYCLQFFPTIASLKPMANVYSDMLRIGYRFGDEATEGYVWLRIAFDNMIHPAVYKCFLDDLSKLKKVIQESLYRQIIDEMIKCCSSYTFAVELLENEPKLVNENVLYERMYALKSVDVHLGFFPYAKWDEELAKKAIVDLINEKVFPVSKFGELSQGLQEFAKNELECAAQKIAISSQSTRVDAVKTKLHQKAEEMLFTSYYYDDKCVKEYITNYKMEEDSFYVLVCGGCITNFSSVVEALVLHAQKWGLTEKQYFWLLQSPLAGYAVMVKDFVK